MAVKENIQQKGLSNPAALALASSPAGQQAISGAVDTTLKVVKITAIVAVVGIGGYIAYRMYKNRFVSMTTNSKYPKSNITKDQAKAKAEALYQAMHGWGANLDTVLETLAGLNYNAYVEVFNAFGKRSPAIGGDMTLTEWLNNQFTSSYDRTQINFILPGIL
ncbi:hypothetical protein [Flavobacterium sp. C4GT6]|uniref:hypothetical protein n=1 Tax=Flavobacterium sp. C4GT6 TaxID=3103818 RepID=UPI002ED02685